LRLELVETIKLARKAAGNDNLSWEEMAKFMPTRKAAQKAVAALQNDPSIASKRHKQLLSLDCTASAIYEPEVASLPDLNVTDNASSDGSSSVDESDIAVSESGEEDNSENKISWQSALEVHEINWQLSQGKKGCLHLTGEDPDYTQCGRCLKGPKTGLGIANAASTGAKWSPRCFQALSSQACEAWLAAINN